MLGWMTVAQEHVVHRAVKVNFSQIVNLRCVRLEPSDSIRIALTLPSMEMERNIARMVRWELRRTAIYLVRHTVSYISYFFQSMKKRA